VRFAILGTRGIPARYGGFETFAEELSTRLTARGHQVTVYCREHYTDPSGHPSSGHPSSSQVDATYHIDPTYRGVRLKYLPTIRHKYFDTVAHTFLSTLHLITARRYDAVLYCNAANAVFTWMPRLFRTPVALNVDGLERNRKKWNALAKAWYRASEWLATWMPNAVVTDAQSIADYYRERYGRESHMIPYGAEIGAMQTSGQTPETCGVLSQLGLERRKYFLYVSRMEPENNALLVREAFEQVDAPMKLALIGDAPYAADYIARVRDTRDSRVVIPGAIYGTGYRELGSHCFAYVHATEVGGTHPALIEAMGRGALTLYLDTPENREVAGGAGIPFGHDNLAAVMKAVLLMPEDEREEWRARAMERVRSRYSWDAVTDAYEKLLRGLAQGKRPDTRRQ
jgi:glycosyltransferase involved in cell wall biosynthesis